MHFNRNAVVDSEGNEEGKIFVGGTSQETNSDHLRFYFCQFGEVEEANIMMDTRTGHSRGFGYVKFKSDASVDQIIRQANHYIVNKYVDVRRSNIHLKGKNRRNLRIFIGGVSLDQSEETLRNYFQQFGKVTDVSLMMDREKRQHRGFAFVGFESESTVFNLIRLHYVQINGKIVEIKALEPPKFDKKTAQPEETRTVKYYTTSVLPNSISPNHYRKKCFHGIINIRL
ncbi:hypothetical protein Ciccas_008145 [Cichlidogyrus casuarinus]|uniref:RRM domain-containing protein n=1 Tax=Cichlidogyrus casuarinus TaxID=1844966 RepID=A0ABD2Q0T1_9PLAT